MRNNLDLSDRDTSQLIMLPTIANTLSGWSTSMKLWLHHTQRKWIFQQNVCRAQPASQEDRGTRLCGASLCTSNYLPEYLDHSIQNIKIICSKSSPSDHVYRLQQGSGFEFEHKSEGACGGVTLCQFHKPLPVTGGRSKIKGLHSFWNPINLSFVAERHNFTIHTLIPNNTWCSGTN